MNIKQIKRALQDVLDNTQNSPYGPMDLIYQATGKLGVTQIPFRSFSLWWDTAKKLLKKQAHKKKSEPL